jgi:hypothetical protein
MSARKKDYTVGFKRPPAEHRFKQGQSGNPRGRPKDRKNFATMLREIVNRKVPVSGSAKRVTMGEAVLHRLFRAAVSGDAKMLGMALALMDSHLGVSADAGSDPELSAREQAILAQFFTAHGGGDESDAD